ncbi:thiamine-phosphate pyrophosphorylase [Haloferula luteola]|uniref:Thiamine-phosphate synthase n=1 Tax=Haloferula luteola TaxID=595692 RepID=A0A840VD36_9BACT|nr:thiamine-phosphate pyrophosphorylase [Haloferula luteola]
MKPSLASARLYAILDLGYVSEPKLEEVARELLEGGADLLQLRAKGYGESDIEGFCRRVLPICREFGVPLIVNDFAKVAAAIGADGVHIGQEDGSLEDVRAIVGEEMIVGRSTHSPEQAHAAQVEGFDYIGFGPLFPTPTKQGRPGIGLENVRPVESTMGSQLPVFCIGGIQRRNLAEVLAAGARRMVIVSDLLTASSIVQATRSVKEQVADR